MDTYTLATLLTRVFVECASVWMLSRALGIGFTLKNPFVIIWVFTLPIFFLKLIVGPAVLLSEGLDDVFYLHAVWIDTTTLTATSLYSVTIILMLQNTVLKSLTPNHTNILIDKTWQNLYPLGWIFLGCGYLFIAILANQKFGLVNWISNPRTGYQYYRSGQGHWYALAVNSLSVAASLLFFFARGRIFFYLAIVPIFFLVYLLGSKAFFLQVATFITIAMIYRKMRESTFALPILIATAAVGMLANFFQSGSNIDIYRVAKYFDYFPNSAKVLELLDSGSMSPFYGNIFSTQFWSAVPRTLITDKPYVYGILHLNEILWPGQTKLGHTPAFSRGLDAYADFGWLGTVLLPFLAITTPLYSMLKVFAVQALKHNSHSTNPIMTIVSLIMIFSPGFLTYLSMPWNVIWLAIVVTAIICARSPKQSIPVSSQLKT